MLLIVRTYIHRFKNSRNVNYELEPFKNNRVNCEERSAAAIQGQAKDIYKK